MRPFSFVAKCQSKNIREQYEVGVRLFDLRVRIDELGQITICHGIMEYKSTHLFDDMRFLNNKKDVIVRAILETSYKDERIENDFKHVCSLFQVGFPSIKFIGGNRKFDWTSIYKFGTFEPAIVGEFASAPSDKWYSKINDLWPWLWAKLHNREVLEAYKDYEGWVMMDFI